jgi:hypothetical protein
MAKCYFELRKQAARGTDSIAADMMRHLHTRQHLGKAVVICDQPVAILAAARKQWLKIARSIQKQRASTLNADKILKYTHTITHMQHMRFSTHSPLEDPEADVYFLSADGCATMPVHCFSIYQATALDELVAAQLVGQLPSEALIIDYDKSTHWGKLGLQSKVMLEQQVAAEWGKVRQFLAGRRISPTTLLHGRNQDIEAMDNALDALLDYSHQFLRIANEFQHTLELARPLRIERSVRQEYDVVVLLAYRVQALSPGAFTQHFLESYNEDDTFFLFTPGKQRKNAPHESLAEAVARHISAGRLRLAAALPYLAAAK